MSNLHRQILLHHEALEEPVSGLPYQRKYWNLQGTALHLESETGKGSIFYFTKTFPVGKISETTVSNPVKASYKNNDKALAGIDILLVEDNPMNVLVAKSFLETWGAKIDVAKNGQEALDILDTDRHKLVLMDLHMPVMDGFEATRKIREKGIDIPIIALTASLPSEIAKEVEDLGIDGTVLKPFQPDDLYKTILRFAFLGADKTV